MFVMCRRMTEIRDGGTESAHVTSCLIVRVKITPVQNPEKELSYKKLHK